MGDRDAAEVGADSDQHLPLLVTRLDACRIRLRVRQLRHVDVLCLLDLLLGAVIDVDRLAAPEHLDHLTIGDRRKVDLDRRARRNRRGVGIHLRDQRHERRGGPERRDRGGRNIEKIATCRLGRRHRRHGCSSFLIRRSARSPLAPAARTHPRQGRLAPPAPDTETPPGGGGRTGRSPPASKGPSGLIQRRFIGTLAKRAQVGKCGSVSQR